MLTLVSHCPPHSSDRCDCEPTNVDENFYKLVPLESPQKKPADTCIRQFLGGDWLKKKKDWSQEGERAFGGGMLPQLPRESRAYANSATQTATTATCILVLKSLD